MEITRQVVLDADVDEVWQALVDEQIRSEWLDDERGFEVVTSEAGRALSWRWAAPGPDGIDSTVSIELHATDDGRTQLTVTERAASADCSLGVATIDVEAWDRRLLGLELRCMSRAAAPALV